MFLNLRQKQTTADKPEKLWISETKADSETARQHFL